MYLVTGANGFMGKYLVERLLQDGKSVLATGRSESPFFNVPNLTYVHMDVSKVDEVNEVFRKYKPEVVFHLAAVIADVCESDPDQAFRVNVRGTENLLQASQRQGSRFVFISSISVYSNDEPQPVREEQGGKPCLLYGITKYYGELVGLWYWRRMGLDFRAVRPGVIFGAGRTRGPSSRYSSAIIDAAIRGEEYVITNPESRVNYIYVRDAVEVTSRLGEVKETPSRVYNAGGFSTTVKEFAEVVRELFPSFVYRVSPSPTVSYVSEVDNSRAEKELDWRPKFDLRGSIKDYARTAKEGSKIFRL